MSKYLSLILIIFCTACSFEVHQIGAETPTTFVITATLLPSLTPKPTDTSLPPHPSPTVAPVEGTTSTQINVRSAPSTVSKVLGILPPNSKVQIVGKDPGENWWQIIYEQGDEGKGWVTAQYVKTASKPEVPVIGGDSSIPENAGIIVQKLNIRSGPGVSFNSIGTLNAQDVVNLTGKDANGAWLQIESAAGPDGKGWVNAAFVQATDVANLPIISDSGQVVGTGTPVDTPPPPSPTVAPAPDDQDSAQAPAVNVTFSANGTRLIQYASDVSSPNGDSDDWIQFTPYTNSVSLQLDCTGNNQITIDLLQNNQLVSGWQALGCGEQTMISLKANFAYLLHIQATSGTGFHYSHYTVTVTSLP